MVLDVDETFNVLLLSFFPNREDLESEQSPLLYMCPTLESSTSGEQLQLWDRFNSSFNFLPFMVV